MKIHTLIYSREKKDGEDFEFVIMGHPYLLDSLLYKLIEISDTNKLLCLSLRMIVPISGMKIRRILLVVESL